MELIQAMVCDRAVMTKDGKLDVHGVFNDLFAPGFPARQERMVLVLGIEWDRVDEGRFTFKIDLLDPSGRPTMTLDGHTDVDRRRPDQPPARTRLVMPLTDVVFMAPGAYRFTVRVKGAELKGPPLHIFAAESAPPVPSAGEG
ncbi:MAG: hypothetical protein EXR95_09060 [Gemmatimonadetes bacterium]|nr:hypothetical protein [Gemmatimonadota bacterium]